jgi:hypothetical protein
VPNKKQSAQVEHYGILMNDIFHVNWKRVFKSLAIFITFAIDGPFILVWVIRFISMGFDYRKTFGHWDLPGVLLLIFIYIPFFSGIFAFLLSQFIRIATVTLTDDKITGSNYWGIKKTIPLTDITKLTRFVGRNGINAIVVNSNNYGKIYISDHTERLNELLNFLAPYLAHKENNKP